MDQNMQVVKRNGDREDVAFDKVQDRVAKASKGLSVNVAKVAQGVLARIVDGITTTELDNITANLAYSWSTIHPDYAGALNKTALGPNIAHMKANATAILANQCTILKRVINASD